MELAKALSQLPGVDYVHLFTRLIDEFVSNAIQQIKAHGIFPDWMPFAHSIDKRKLKRLLDSGF